VHQLPPLGSRPKRREPSEAAALLTPARQAPRWSGELASVTPPVSALHVYCQAPRWGGSARATRRRSLRRGPTATSAAGRGGPQTRGGAGPRVPRAFARSSGPSARPSGCADASLGAARRAWGIPLAGGASPLPRVKYPGHFASCVINWPRWRQICTRRMFSYMEKARYCKKTEVRNLETHTPKTIPQPPDLFRKHI
jgi:hypothetical protein